MGRKESDMGSEIDKIEIKDTGNVRVPKIPGEAKPQDLVRVTQAASYADADGGYASEFVWTIEDLQLFTKLCIFEADENNPNLDEIGDNRMEELINDIRRPGRPRWEVSLESYYGSYTKHVFEGFAEVPANKVTVIVPSVEGLFDADHKPSVYPGHLTKEEILEATRETAYKGQAICESVEEAFLVTFTNDEGDVPHRDETGTWFSLEDHAKGHLTYHVFLTEEEK
jgi:hypothetical protein